MLKVYGLSCLILLSGCSTFRTAQSPLIYEDANIAIYRVCQEIPTSFAPPVCHEEIIQKHQTTDLNANLAINKPTNTEQKKEQNNTSF